MTHNDHFNGPKSVLGSASDGGMHKKNWYLAKISCSEHLLKHNFSPKSYQSDTPVNNEWTAASHRRTVTRTTHLRYNLPLPQQPTHVMLRPLGEQSGVTITTAPINPVLTHIPSTNTPMEREHGTSCFFPSPGRLLTETCNTLDFISKPPGQSDPSLQRYTGRAEPIR